MAKKKEEAELSDYVFGKLQPQALPLEEAVLGALMLDKAAFSVVSQFLEEKHFYSEAHQAIFRAIARLDSRSNPIDMLTVTEELKRSGELDSIGGGYYVVELTSRVGSSANIEYHARIIVQKWLMRHLIQTCSNAIRDAYEDTNDPMDVIKDFEVGFSEISRNVASDALTAEQVSRKLEKSSKEAFDRGGDGMGYDITGLKKLEEIYGGANPGRLIVLSGDSGSGKSSLFNNALCNAVVNDAPIYAWSHEMSDEDMLARMLSAFSSINSFSIKSGKYFASPSDLASIEAATNLLIGKKVFLDYGSMTLTKLRATIVNKHRTSGVKLFMFDRMELFDLSSASKDADSAKAIFIQMLRGLATELGITIIVAAQMRKEAIEKRNKKRPEMYDIMGSASQYQSATTVLLIYRPEMYGIDAFDDGTPSKGMAEIIVAKNTHGSTGSAKVEFSESTTIFGLGYFQSREDDIPVANPFAEPFVPQKVLTVPSKMNDDDETPF